MKKSTLNESASPFDASICHQFPLRDFYVAQVVIPRNMTKDEADRLCAFVQSLAAPEKLVEQGEIQ